MAILLKILSPEKLILEKEVRRVELPGGDGRFVVLQDHAPLISSLVKGKIEYTSGDGASDYVAVDSGFVEVSDNKVTACVEL